MKILQVSYTQDRKSWLDDIVIDKKHLKYWIISSTLTRRYGPGITNILIVKEYCF